ncbi:MAG TPA: VWA domain-containing protein [Byssovorax sp.]
MLRELDQLLWALRRDGFSISTAQAIDATRAFALVGFDEPARLKAAIAAVVVTRRAEIAPFRASFDRYFATGLAHANDLFARLRDRGFDATEVGALRELLEAVAERSGATGDAPALAALLGTDGDLERLLRAANVARVLGPMTSPLQIGFFTQQAVAALGFPRAASAMKRLRDALIEALGPARGAALADAVAEELERAKRRVREHVSERLKQRLGEPEDAPRSAADRAFFALSTAEIDEVRLAVRKLAERLRGGERVRRRRARRGRVDARATARRSLATGGVPFVPARKRRRRDKPRLVLVCDVSESVRAASLFMLELVSAAQELFSGTRSFVFVSELAEVTRLFARGAEVAVAAILSGQVVSLAHNSNYGRALAAFEEATHRAIDRRTTVVVLGDGRTNYLDDRADVVARLRERARAVLWITPEGTGGWGMGDSAMPRYAAAATDVLVARTARELEAAAREVAARRK